MKAIMLTFALLSVLLCWMLPADSKKISVIFTSQKDELDIPVNMAENSVDDMYSSCSERMENIVLKKYFAHEKESGIFKDVWKTAENCVKKISKEKGKKDKALTKHHMQAICVYTSGYRGFYDTFNKAVRTGRADYGKGFQFHSLYFWLTRAVQVLQKGCYTTYRRTTAKFTGEVNKIIRFGSFTSTSKFGNLTHFGDKTCFQIKTCSGAYLKNYPKLRGLEQEVLIPPYEMFKITQIIPQNSQSKPVELDDCETVYVLETAGIKSNLECCLARATKQ